MDEPQETSYYEFEVMPRLFSDVLQVSLLFSFAYYCIQKMSILKNVVTKKTHDASYAKRYTIF